VSDLLVWIDCEMTGLDLGRDQLIEVAVVVTGADLVPLDSGLDVVIKVPDVALDSMVDVVRDMHDRSGLTASVRAATTTLSQAEDMVLEYVQKHVPEPRTAPLCGNSIATDRGFIARDMPRLDAHLHYRMIDVSSVKELCRRWYPRAYFGQPSKGLSHRALVDILESIRELEFYRRAIFVPPPGPDVETAKVIAAQLFAEQAPER
jgi:oligoribonuclease